jgi:CRISPR-associated protein Cmr3
MYVQQPNSQAFSQLVLLQALTEFPSSWVLTPVNGKKIPYRQCWQSEQPISHEEIAKDIRSGKAKGVGLRTGGISGGIIAIDADGPAAHEKILELSNSEALPNTVAFSSNRPGRCQYLFYIPPEYWESIRTTKIGTGVKGDDGKEEKLELRWDGCQSVLPPSAHPSTGVYQWRKSFTEIAIAPAPMWVIKAMLIEQEPQQPERHTTAYTRKARTGEQWTDTEWALSYLSALNSYRADDYDDWLTVGMALHSADNSLLTEWDTWSSQSPKYKPGVCEKKWKSFKGQGVSLGSLAHMAKEDGWRSPFQKSTGRSYSSNKKRSNSGGSDGSGGDGGQPIVELSLRDRILEILDRNQERSHRDEAFIKLAKTTGATTKEIKDLAASLESEVDLEESRIDRKTEVENLLKVGKYQLELHDYLDLSVAQPLNQIAKWMGTTPAAMLTTLYPVIGSLLKVGTRLELIKATDFYALAVIFSGLVCESGGGKTPAQKTILKPLFALQAEEEIEYKKRLLEYQQELVEWKKVKDNQEPAPEQPVPREYYTTDATSEAIALIQNQQPCDGFLGWFDELPALFKSQGQYKSGRGADGEKILSGRDGTGFKVNRASGKRLVVNESAYSITGSLQPLVLRQMMGDFTDANGQWARFLWTVMQVQPAPYPDNAIPFDVLGLLKGIYKRLRNLPPVTYTLSSEAKKAYRNWYNQLDRLKMAESRQGLRAVYSKMKGDVGTLALLLHCFNGCVTEGYIPALEVSEATMLAAIKLSKYHIGQVKLIHSEGDAANGDLSAIHAKIIQLSERKGWLKAADVRDIDRQVKKKFSADDIRHHFQELEASGFGQTKGTRTKLMWSIYKNTPPNDTPRHSDKTQDSFEQLRTNSGQKSPNSGQTQDSLEIAESITNISVQQLVVQTQDTQDSFLSSAVHSLNPLSAENEIKATDLNFSVLSCPEFNNEAENQEAVGIPEDVQTQGNCPEFVLSCPEFDEISNDSNKPTANPQLALAKLTAFLEILEAYTKPYFEREVLIATVAEMCAFEESWEGIKATMKTAELSDEERLEVGRRWDELGHGAKTRQLYKQYQQKTEQPEVVFEKGDRVQYQHWYGILAAHVSAGWLVQWDKLSKSCIKRHGEIPAIAKHPLKEADLKLISKATHG